MQKNRLSETILLHVHQLVLTENKQKLENSLNVWLIQSTDTNTDKLKPSIQSKINKVDTEARDMDPDRAFLAGNK